MDPITGLAALAGISLATVAGLRLKKTMKEPFAPLPDEETKYTQSVEQSQSRYNMFSGLVNPLTNSIIPVGTPDSTIKERKDLTNAALGSYKAEFSPNASQNLILRNFENQYKARSDDNSSLYEAIKFCREAGKGENPFDAKKKYGPGEDDEFVFKEICGVCISSGVDEEGKRFRKPQGMLVDPDARDRAIEEKDSKGWAFARVKPAIGTCEGAPNEPVFATNQEDLDRYGARAYCLNAKTLGGKHSCALCYESDNIYSSVSEKTQRNPISLVLQGTGSCTVRVANRVVGEKQLSESTPVTIELLEGKEGEPFVVQVTSVSGSQVPTNVYGYMMSKTPKDGLFTMPLNLLVLNDDDNMGASPSKSGGFHTFKDIGLGVAKMRPAAGKTSMRLRGTIPFTFVQSGELAAMDCLEAPFQRLITSASAFSTDQPCFAKGARPGKYNDECLRQRILDAGCTNAGTLYKNPSQLNTKGGATQALDDIYITLQGIAEKDMIDISATKLCTGRSIQTPCDPFIERSSLKFGAALRSTDPTLVAQAQQCLSFLYHNKGASEKAKPPRVGPTYTGLVTYKNNQKEIKNIYCLPEGKLNPDTNPNGRDTLARVADTGYGGKVGVDAVKAYLNDQLSVATDNTRNGNTDPERKAAMLNCFGTDFKNLPAVVGTDPKTIQNPCGVIAQYIRVLPSQSAAPSEAFIEISQLAVIDKTGKNVAAGKSTAGTTPPYPPHGFGTHSASFAIDGQIYPKSQNFYVSANPGGNSQFLLNLGEPTDITKIIYINRGDHTSSNRKNGIRLQLLDSNQQVVEEKRLNYNQREDILFTEAGGDPSCKSDLPAPAPFTLPSDSKPGVFVRFYDITDPNPDLTPGNRGWGQQMGTPNAYGRINFNDWNLARHDQCGVVAKGYYYAQGPETLYLMTDSDDGIYVSFNGKQVIRNWTIHAPQRDTAAPIQIPAAGAYPFELRFYEWGGGAVCNLYFKVNDEMEWRTDMTTRFGFKPSDVEREQQELEAAQRAAREEERLRIEAEKLRLQRNTLMIQSFKPGYNVAGGTVQNNGDYILSFNIKPTGLVGDWASIFRFRIRAGNCCDFGQRAPAFWFWPGSTELHVIIGDSTDGNWGIHRSFRLQMNVDYQIVLECKGSNITLSWNTADGRGNILTQFATQPSRRPTGTANLLLGDGDYHPAQCEVTNFKFTPLN